MPPDFDESRMEGLMEDLARETEGIDEDDPRKMAGLMRKLYQGTGLPLSEKMEEAIRRMEAGEDPDRIEEEMGNVLDEEDPLLGEGGQRSPGGLKGIAAAQATGRGRDALRSLTVLRFQRPPGTGSFFGRLDRPAVAHTKAEKCACPLAAQPTSPPQS